ncbi:MAG: hypothetical protein NZ989_08070, partial [Bacteroidia bacterium]|nr:hypothetical protein [Bacteroidia bacterium]
FLNMLSADQVVQRGFTINTNRMHIAGVWPTYSTNFPHRAMGNLSYTDLLSYLDWAGLSPMTEFEYEKACRGPNIPIAGEYA